MTTLGAKPRSEAIDALIGRALETHRTPEPGFPHYADTASGRWTRSPDGDWTGGFFVGELWLAASLGVSGARDAATEWSRALLPRAQSDTVFRGFLFWYGAGIGAQLLGDPEARRIASIGAQGLASSFDEDLGLITLGGAAEEAHSVGKYETNIDGVPGSAPLLYWAADNGGGATMIEMARSHVERHTALLLRDDDSVIQSATLDPRTGAAVKTYTHKGVSDTSTWARAQAWAMLGLSQAAQHDPERFAAPLRRVCDWWTRNLPASGISYWDFDASADVSEPLVDTAATAIAAAALLKARSVAGMPGRDYEKVATTMVTTLVTDYLDLRSADTPPRGVLGGGCYNHRENLATSNELVWGTYFLLESLLVLGGEIDSSLI